MNTPLPAAPAVVRHFAFVTLLTCFCLMCSACHSGTQARAAAASGPAQVHGQTQAQARPALGMDPAAPLDERPVTTMETVGAAAD